MTPLALFLLCAPPSTAAPLTAAQQARVTPTVAVVRDNQDAVLAIQATHVVTAQQSVFDFFLPADPSPGLRGSIGSGSIIHSSGYVLTNAHVTAQGSELSVVLRNGHALPAHLVAAMPDEDVAIIKIDGLVGELPIVTLGSTSDVMVGESVVAIGSPVGLQSSVTTGIVSAVDRDLQPTPRTRMHGLLQTDAAINPGSSGGPLFNVVGEQIGINTAIRSDAQNVGFAIPVDRVRALLPRLLSVEGRGRDKLGLELGRELPGGGVVVERVQRGSPAHKAGLEAGMIVRGVAGRSTQTLIDALVGLLEQPAGKAFEVRAELPEGAVDVFRVTVEALPPPDGAGLARRHLALAVADLDAATAARLGLRAGAGVVVRAVERGSAADGAGVLPGDLVTRVGPYGIRRVTDLSVLEGVQGGAEVAVRVVRISRGRVLQAEVVLNAR